MSCAILTYRENRPVAEIWNGTYTQLKDVVWFLSVEEARACVRPGYYDLVWDRL